ncbi:MAG: methylated-DNA--[protein]-cysteine S-methyltransferase [Gammaproteobacteria bacterium]|nr:methylated-DNA--[protein]-cysteine S-methyltransferase [Gammaproteobacteria bacterium]
MTIEWISMLLERDSNSYTDNEQLKATCIDTPLGQMFLVTDDSSLHLLEFSDRRGLPNEVKRLNKYAKGDIGIGRFNISDQIESELDAYFTGKSAEFTVPLTEHGSEFTRTVWQALRAIPAGTTRTYAQIAKQVGRETAVRAMARSNGANQIAVIIPCHRVLGADGSLTGYGGGLWRKQKLIDLEALYYGK